MQLISLNLENFRQHRRTSIDFRSGITGIIGKNGAGKTTLLEAIAWALYGAPAVRGKNAGIRCRASGANEPVEVRLSFSLDGQTYDVTRRLDAQGRPQGASLSVNGIPSRTGFTEVTDSIVKTLGMDYKAFFTSFFTAQKQLDFMSGMDGRERAESISKMLGYERLTNARDRANQDRLALQHEVEGLERGLPNPEELKVRKVEAKKALDAALEKEKAESKQLVSVEAEVKRLSPLKEASEQKAKLYEELSRRIESDTRDTARAQVRLKQLGQEIADLDKKATELNNLSGIVAEYNDAQKEHNALSELQKHEAERQRISGQLEAIRRDVEQLTRQIASVGNVKESLTKIQEALNDAEKQLREVQTRLNQTTETWIAQKHRLATEIETHSRSFEDVLSRRSAIERAGADGKCPTCERPLENELDKVLAGFDEQAIHENEKLTKLKSSAEAAKKEPPELSAAKSLSLVLEKTIVDRRREKEEVDKRVSELTSYEKTSAAKRVETKVLEESLAKLPLGFDQKRFEELRNKGIELRKKRDIALQLEAEVKRLPNLRVELKEEEKTCFEKFADIATAQKAIQELSFSSEEHERLMLDFGKASDALVSTKIELERRRGEVKEARATLGAVESEEESCRIKLAELKKKQENRLYLRALAEAFDSLRLELNNQIRPELEETSSEILSDLTDRRYNLVAIDDNYAAWIIEDGERKPIISGGEGDVLNLALRLAVSQMIANRSGHPLSLLVLDEVFGSLDDSRRDNVMSLLANLRNRFEQIILITHIESIRDTVDNCVWLQYDEENGISRIRDGEPVEVSGFTPQLL